MKTLKLLSLLIAFAMVFWFSPDAAAPVGMMIPCLVIGFGGGITFELIASVLGIIGVVVALLAASDRKKSLLLPHILLVSSILLFAWTSSKPMVTLASAIPFAVLAILFRRTPGTEKTIEPA